MKVKPRNNAKNEGQHPSKPTFTKSCPEISILDKAVFCVFGLISHKIGTFGQNTVWTSPLQIIDNQALYPLDFCPEPVQNCPASWTKTVQNAKTLLSDLQHVTSRFSKSVQNCPAFVHLKRAFLGLFRIKRPLFEVWTFGQSFNYCPQVWTLGTAGLLTVCVGAMRHNGRGFMSVQPLDKTNEPHGLAQLGGVSGENEN